jgi:chaperonin cofactor prefoldin
MEGKMSPVECLAHDEKVLTELQAGNTAVPSWMSQEQAIKEVEESIEYLKTHIATHGNQWPESLLTF